MHLDRRERQVDLLAKVTEVIRNVRLVQAFAREAHFERAFRHGGHDVVRSGLAVADAEQLSRALLNLVTNAVRHTREGDMLRLACTSSYGWARLVVADSGDGIRPGDLAHVFSPWYRANMREVGVGGLGLMIVREVARTHGGDVEVESQAAVGTTFTIRLPLLPEPVLTCSQAQSGAP